MALSAGRGCPGPPPGSPQLTQPLGDDDKSPGGQTRQPRFDEVLHSDSSHGIDAGGCSAGGYKGGERGVLRPHQGIGHTHPGAYLLGEAPSCPHHLACQDPQPARGQRQG